MVLQRNGDAAYDAYNDRYVLTPDAPSKHGSFMSPKRVDLSTAFDITFDINVGNNADGADGMGFVLHNDPLGTSARRSRRRQGMSGIKNGIGIEFDTYYNPLTRMTSSMTTPVLSTPPTASADDREWPRQYRGRCVASGACDLEWPNDLLHVRRRTNGDHQPGRGRNLLGDQPSPTSASPGTPAAGANRSGCSLITLTATTEDGGQVHLDRAALPQPVTFRNQWQCDLRRVQQILHRHPQCTAPTRQRDGRDAGRPQQDLPRSPSTSTSATTTMAPTAWASCCTMILLGNKALGDAAAAWVCRGSRTGIGIEFDTYYNATIPMKLSMTTPIYQHHQRQRADGSEGPRQHRGRSLASGRRSCRTDRRSPTRFDGVADVERLHGHGRNFARRHLARLLGSDGRYRRPQLSRRRCGSSSWTPLGRTAPLPDCRAEQGSRGGQ